MPSGCKHIDIPGALPLSPQDVRKWNAVGDAIGDARRDLG
jgi:hypothetical protein